MPPKKDPAANLIAEEKAINDSTLRRSTRISSISSPIPATISSRRNSQTDSASTPSVTKTRRVSLSQDNSNETEGKPATRSRRASQTQEDTKPTPVRRQRATIAPSKSPSPEPKPKPVKSGSRRSSVASEASESSEEYKNTKKQRKSNADVNAQKEETTVATPARRGRKSSVTLTEDVEKEETKKPVRSRRSSVNKEDSEDSNKTETKKITRGRRSSVTKEDNDKSEKGEIKKVTRGRRSSVTKEDLNEVEDKKSRKDRSNSVNKDDLDTAVQSTPIKGKRRPSITENAVSLDPISEKEDEGVAVKNLSPETKELSIKLTPIKKKKPVLIKTDLDLSIITEGEDLLDVSKKSDKGTPKTSPQLNKPIDVSEGKSPGKLINRSLSKVSNISNGSDGSFHFHLNVSLSEDETNVLNNISHGSNTSDKENINLSGLKNESVEKQINSIKELAKSDEILNESEQVVNREVNSADIEEPMEVDESFKVTKSPEKLDKSNILPKSLENIKEAVELQEVLDKGEFSKLKEIVKDQERDNIEKKFLNSPLIVRLARDPPVQKTPEGILIPAICHKNLEKWPIETLFPEETYSMSPKDKPNLRDLSKTIHKDDKRTPVRSTGVSGSSAKSDRLSESPIISDAKNQCPSPVRNSRWSKSPVTLTDVNNKQETIESTDLTPNKKAISVNLDSPVRNTRSSKSPVNSDTSGTNISLNDNSTPKKTPRHSLNIYEVNIVNAKASSSMSSSTSIKESSLEKGEYQSDSDCKHCTEPTESFISEKCILKDESSVLMKSETIDSDGEFSIKLTLSDSDDEVIFKNKLSPNKLSEKVHNSTEKLAYEENLNLEKNMSEIQDCDKNYEFQNKTDVSSSKSNAEKVHEQKTPEKDVTTEGCEEDDAQKIIKFTSIGDNIESKSINEETSFKHLEMPSTSKSFTKQVESEERFKMFSEDESIIEVDLNESKKEKKNNRKSSKQSPINKSIEREDTNTFLEIENHIEHDVETSLNESKSNKNKNLTQSSDYELIAELKESQDSDIFSKNKNPVEEDEETVLNKKDKKPIRNDIVEFEDNQDSNIHLQIKEQVNKTSVNDAETNFNESKMDENLVELEKINNPAKSSEDDIETNLNDSKEDKCSKRKSSMQSSENKTIVELEVNKDFKVKKPENDIETNLENKKDKEVSKTKQAEEQEDDAESDLNESKKENRSKRISSKHSSTDEFMEILEDSRNSETPLKTDRQKNDADTILNESKKDRYSKRKSSIQSSENKTIVEFEDNKDSEVKKPQTTEILNECKKDKHSKRKKSKLSSKDDFIELGDSQVSHIIKPENDIETNLNENKMAKEASKTKQAEEQEDDAESDLNESKKENCSKRISSKHSSTDEDEFMAILEESRNSETPLKTERQKNDADTILNESKKDRYSKRKSSIQSSENKTIGEFEDNKDSEVKKPENDIEILNESKKDKHSKRKKSKVSSKDDNFTELDDTQVSHIVKPYNDIETNLNENKKDKEASKTKEEQEDDAETDLNESKKENRSKRKSSKHSSTDEFMAKLEDSRNSETPLKTERQKNDADTILNESKKDRYSKRKSSIQSSENKAIVEFEDNKDSEVKKPENDTEIPKESKKDKHSKRKKSKLSSKDDNFTELGDSQVSHIVKPDNDIETNLNENKKDKEASKTKEQEDDAESDLNESKKENCSKRKSSKHSSTDEDEFMAILEDSRNCETPLKTKRQKYDADTILNESKKDRYSKTKKSKLSSKDDNFTELGDNKKKKSDTETVHNETERDKHSKRKSSMQTSEHEDILESKNDISESKKEKHSKRRSVLESSLKIKSQTDKQDSQKDGSKSIESSSSDENLFENLRKHLAGNKSTDVTDKSLNNRSYERKGFKKEEEISDKLDKYVRSRLAEMQKDKEENTEANTDKEVEEEEEYSNQNEFINDMAEEFNEEESPFEDSNEIIDVGESIQHSSTDKESDDEYDSKSSFICNDEEDELLSGEEYDLEIDDDTKGRKSRIIEIGNIVDDDGIVRIKPNNRTPKKLKKPSIIEILDSSEEEVKLVKDKIKPTDVRSLKENKLEISNENLKPNLESEKLTQKPKASITIHENIRVGDIKDAALSERLSTVVEAFYSTVKKSGEISLNLSIEYNSETEKQNKQNSSEEDDVFEKTCSKISPTFKKDKKSKKNTSNILETDVESSFTKKQKSSKKIINNSSTDLENSFTRKENKSAKKRLSLEKLEENTDSLNRKIGKFSKQYAEGENQNKSLTDPEEHDISEEIRSKTSPTSKKGKKSNKNISTINTGLESSFTVKGETGIESSFTRNKKKSTNKRLSLEKLEKNTNTQNKKFERVPVKHPEGDQNKPLAGSEDDYGFEKTGSKMSPTSSKNITKDDKSLKNTSSIETENLSTGKEKTIDLESSFSRNEKNSAKKLENTISPNKKKRSSDEDLQSSDGKKSRKHSKSTNISERLSATAEDIYEKPHTSGLKRRLSKSVEEINKIPTKKFKKQKKTKKEKSVKISPKKHKYITDDLKAGTFNIMNQLINDDLKNRPKRIIKPSIPANIDQSWISEIDTVKPSTSLEEKKKKKPDNDRKFHPKDFKSQMLYDPSRVNRVDTKILLKKKGAY